MRVTKISLATMLALGTLTCASATTQLEEAIKGTTIGGYAYGQYTGMFGDDADGSAFRSRVWVDINTGAISGFSLGTRVFASIGQGAPNGGRFLANSGIPNNVAAFGMYALYGKYSFEALGSKTTMMGGKINIMTPFNDTAWDYGYGLYVSNEDIEGIKFSAQAYAAWALDNGNAMYTTIAQDANKNQLNYYDNKASLSTQNPLFILGVEGGGEKLAGAAFKLYAATSPDTIDYLVFGDVSYSILDTGVTLQSQVAVTSVNTDNAAFAYGNPFITADTTDYTAKLRGLYNIQVSYSNKDLGFGAKAGFTGSFGDGYGALLNYASFNMGGQFWYDTVSSYNGYGITGVGGHKRMVANSDGTFSAENTDIMVGYVGVTYSGVQNLKLGLDYAYVGGNNNYVRMVKSRDNATAKIAEAQAANQPVNPQDIVDAFNTDATFHEVSFTASYDFIPKKLTLSGLIGMTFGDLQMGRGRVNLKYSF